MLFSLEWLLSLCPVPGGPAEIAAALTARGLTVDSWSSSGAGDHVFDVDIPANRPDCLGHLGLARELSAAFAVPLQVPEAARTEAQEVDWLEVEIADPLLCPRYTAGLVRGVRIGPSPRRVVDRLTTCGLRPLNNVVDISNLILLELGHPVHFFDFRRLAASSAGRPLLVVRPARPAERLETLDGIERRLDPTDLVIADGEHAVALAGIIGGADSPIGADTRDVLVEAAAFQPARVRATARRLGLATDASFRFERGVDPATALAAQALAARWLAELAGGDPAPGIVDRYPGRKEPRRLTLRPHQLRRLLGFQPDAGSVHAALTALGLAPQEREGEPIAVSVPSWRVDLEREADLVEEVARHVGYDRIPTPDLEIPPVDAAAARTRSEGLRDRLAHLGFHEAFGYSMIAENEDEPFVLARTPPALRLTNPIAEPLAVMRRSILPGLLRAAELNLRRGNHDVRLFEVGRVFLEDDPEHLPREPQHVGLVAAGTAQPRHWSGGARELDLNDSVGFVEHLLAWACPGIAFERLAEAPAAFHPGQSVAWRRGPGGPAFAWTGALHPEIQRRIDFPLWLAEIDLDALPGLQPGFASHAPLSRVPAVSRDLSLVLAPGQSYGQLLAALGNVSAPTPVTFEALDRYVGRPLADGEVSLTVRVTLHPQDKTLTDDETEGYRQRLIATLERDLGIRIRA